MTVRSHPARVPLVLGVALALAVAASPGLTAAASPAETSGLVIEGGVTQPVHGYADAVRETVIVAGAVSSHDGGEVDELMVDIIRPAASEESLAVPTIVIPSPYYEEAWGVGRAREFKPDPDGPIDHFPQYYDNYFVPRGYAVALVDLAGTRGSTGCLDAGGPAEIDNTVKVIEWLAGADGSRAYDLDGSPVGAGWSNGRSAILGASWNGAVANGVAARGVEGLATIVPIAAISTWHAYHWSNGVLAAQSPLALSDAVRSVPDEQCQQTRDLLADGGQDPDPTTPFWVERDYVRDADQVQASVFVQHGLNDYNVAPVHLDRWWAALAEHDVPRKIWLAQTEHARAFDFRREEWVATIHRWFDHWLHGIDNAIMDEPMADVEHAPGEWTTYEDWPAGTATTLRPGQPEGDDDPRAGVLSLNRRDLQPRAQTFTETHQPLDQAAADGFDDERSDRLVFMTDELTAPVRLSGASRVSLRASIDGPDASLSAYLVDYGQATRTDWTQDTGLRDLATSTCFGEGTEADTGCYLDVERRTRTRPFEVVARGWANASFLTGANTFDPDESHRLTWEIMTDDYVFEAGHRIGIVLSGIGEGARAPRPRTASDVTVHLNGSHVQLPIVGGPPALRAATR